MAWLAPGFHQISASPAARRIEEAGRAFEAKRAAKLITYQGKMKPEPTPRAERLPNQSAWLSGMWIAIDKGVDAQPVHRIAAEVCEKYRVTLADLRSAKRQTLFKKARLEFYYRAITETNRAYAEVGRFLKKDHTSVMGGIRRYAFLNGLPLPRGLTKGRRYE